MEKGKIIARVYIAGKRERTEFGDASILNIYVCYLRLFDSKAKFNQSFFESNYYQKVPFFRNE